MISHRNRTRGLQRKLCESWSWLLESVSHVLIPFTPPTSSNHQGHYSRWDGVLVQESRQGLMSLPGSPGTRHVARSTPHSSVPPRFQGVGEGRVFLLLCPISSSTYLGPLLTPVLSPTVGTLSSLLLGRSYSDLLPSETFLSETLFTLCLDPLSYIPVFSVAIPFSFRWSLRASLLFVILFRPKFISCWWVSELLFYFTQSGFSVLLLLRTSRVPIPLILHRVLSFRYFVEIPFFLSVPYFIWHRTKSTTYTFFLGELELKILSEETCLVLSTVTFVFIYIRDGWWTKMHFVLLEL